MVDRVYEYMIRYSMTVPGSRVLAAVSGGADSMCLLKVLIELQPRAGFDLRVLHVHHGLRENADDDLAFVSKYCSLAGVPMKAVLIDAGGYASKNGMSVEEAARILRYRALEHAAAEWDKECSAPEQSEGRKAAEQAGNSGTSAAEQACGATAGACRIAVAHHIEDQAETVLFNLVRGSRLTGLRGMLPVNGRIIRPMLEVSRGEIETFLRERGCSWREDETNEDIRYSRNLLRKEVMPLLMQVNAGAREHIARAAEEAAQTEDFLRGETERVLKACRGSAQETGQAIASLRIPVLAREPELLRRRAVYEVISDAAGGKKDVQDAHVQAVLRLMQKQGNGELDLVNRVHVKKVYELLYVYGAPALSGVTKGSAPQEYGQQDAAKAALRDDFCRWPTGAGDYTCRVISFHGDLSAVPRNQCTKWFDYDKMRTFPDFRNRREGDRITLDESGRSKTIARYMIDEKIPRELRERIVMPALGSEILWVPAPYTCGLQTGAADRLNGADNLGRISAAYKVTPGTRRVLEIRWEPEGGERQETAGKEK